MAKRRDNEQSYQAYLDAYPNGRFVAPARVALQSLRPAARTSSTSHSATAAPVVTTINSRYEVLGDGSEVRDRTSNLIWKRCTVGQTWTGNSCSGKSSRFTFDDAPQLATGGWRVPTIRELSTLIRCVNVQTEETINLGDGGAIVRHACKGSAMRANMDPDAFPGADLGNTWSSSPSASGAAYAWAFQPLYGALVNGDSRTNGYAVRLVRSAP